MIHLESNVTCIRYLQLQLLAVAFSFFFGFLAEKVVHVNRGVACHDFGMIKY